MTKPSTLLLLIATSVLFLGQDIFAEDKDGWISLFNGRDLSGWKANILPESFSVKNGAIKTHCKDPEQRKAHLFYVGQNGKDVLLFKDFEFEALVRSEPVSNSGVFFHTDEAIRDKKYHLGSGYEVQINNGDRPKSKTGSLFAIADFEDALIDDTQWFKLTIKVEGKRIQVFLNDQPTVDYTEPENPDRPEKRKDRLLRTEGGAIALQGHDPYSTVYFKNIRIRRL